MTLHGTISPAGSKGVAAMQDGVWKEQSLMEWLDISSTDVSLAPMSGLWGFETSA